MPAWITDPLGVNQLIDRDQITDHGDKWYRMRYHGPIRDHYQRVEWCHDHVSSYGNSWRIGDHAKRDWIIMMDHHGPVHGSAVTADFLFESQDRLRDFAAAWAART